MEEATFKKVKQLEFSDDRMLVEFEDGTKTLYSGVQISSMTMTSRTPSSTVSVTTF